MLQSIPAHILCLFIFCHRFLPKGVRSLITTASGEIGAFDYAQFVPIAA